MKDLYCLALTFMIIFLLSGGCAASSQIPTVTINDLASAPEQYSGKAVTVEGIYAHGWEWIILAESIAFLGAGDSRELKPVGEAIWFAGLVPRHVQEGLYQFSSAEFGVQTYGKVRVTGLFETEGKYGHMHKYKYRITASKVELLEWTPPE